METYRVPKTVREQIAELLKSEQDSEYLGLAKQLTIDAPIPEDVLKLIDGLDDPIFAPVENWLNKILHNGFTHSLEILKVDDSLGLVLGYGIICTEEGEDYFDLQGDHIPEDAMLKAATDFMLNSRKADTMHDFEEMGTVVFAWPMTEEIAKAYELDPVRTGLMIARKPSDEVLEKFKSGEFTGFSIGGKRIKDEVVEDG